MNRTQFQQLLDVATTLEIDDAEIVGGDLTLRRLRSLPEGARPRVRNVVVFVCTETGADYRLEADEIYDTTGSVLAKVTTERFLVLPTGDKICVPNGIWKIRHCG
jgi:hypothetical protein